MLETVLMQFFIIALKIHDSHVVGTVFISNLQMSNQGFERNSYPVSQLVMADLGMNVYFQDPNVMLFLPMF